MTDVSAEKIFGIMNQIEIDLSNSDPRYLHSIVSYIKNKHGIFKSVSDSIMYSHVKSGIDKMQNNANKPKIAKVANNVVSKKYSEDVNTVPCNNLTDFYSFEDQKDKFLKCLFENFLFQKSDKSLNICEQISIDGISGSGKSFFVQCMAGHFKLPLITFDLCTSFSLIKDFEVFTKQTSKYLSNTGQWALILIDNIDIKFDEKSESSDSEMNLNFICLLKKFVVTILNSDVMKAIFVISSKFNIMSNQHLCNLSEFSVGISLPIPDQATRKLLLTSMLNKKQHRFTEDQISRLTIATPGFNAGDLKKLLISATKDVFWKDNIPLFETMRSQLNLESDLTHGEILHRVDDAKLFEAMYKHAKQMTPISSKYGFSGIPDVSWSSIGGLDDIKKELKYSVLSSIVHPDLSNFLNVKMSSGIIFEGPPGCGKTLLAKALANEAGVNFISIKGPELLSMYVGESERSVRNIFENARKSSPCVLFFDEIDSLCPSRGSDTEGSSQSNSQHVNRLTNQMLTEMDGMETRTNVFVLAATNRIQNIDKAILRPGRFDKIIKIPIPDSSMRYDILMKTIRKIPLMEFADKTMLEDTVRAISDDKKTANYSGADLSGLVKNCCLLLLKTLIDIESLEAESFTNMDLEDRNLDKDILIKRFCEILNNYVYTE